MANINVRDEELDALKKRIRANEGMPNLRPGSMDFPDDSFPSGGSLFNKLGEPPARKPEEKLYQADIEAGGPVTTQPTELDQPEQPEHEEVSPVPSTDPKGDTKEATRQLGSFFQNPGKADPTALRDALDRLDKVAAAVPEPENNSGLLAELRDARKQAADLYKSKADTNAWLSLAVTIGNSLTKLAAANEGLKQGVDLSKVQTTPFDMDAANAAAYKQYRDAVSDAMSDYSISDEARKERVKAARDKYEQEVRSSRDTVDVEKYKYGKSADSYDRYLADIARQRNADERDKAAENRADKRESDRNAALAAAQARDARNTELKDLANQSKDLGGQVQAADQLASLAAGYDKLDGKAQKKADLQMLYLAAKARIPPEKMSEIEEAADKAAYWGLDRELRAALIRKAVESVRGDLQKVEERRRALSNASNEPAQVSSKQKKSVPSSLPNDRVAITKNGEPFSVPRSQLKQALSQGYKEMK